MVKLGSPCEKDGPDDGQAEAVFGGVQGAGGLEALRGELTAAQLATKHGIHQTMVGEWKQQAMEGLAAVFSGRADGRRAARSAEAEVEKLHAKIGQLLVERDFLAKASGR